MAGARERDGSRAVDCPTTVASPTALTSVGINRTSTAALAGSSTQLRDRLGTD
jgi:hypothetical protein